MWWDWSDITLLDSVLFSLISLLILYLVGSGVLRLICRFSKKTDPFSSFDFIVKTNFRIFFGFVFVFLFIYVLSTVNFPFIASTLVVVVLTALGFVVTRKTLKMNFSERLRLKNCSYVIIVSVVLLVIVFFSSMLIAGSYGTTNDDGAEHTLIVRIILDNPNSLLTRNGLPYLNDFLKIPSGVHVLSAFFVSLLGVSIQKIILMVGAILPILIALSFYSTLKCLFNRKDLSIIGLILSAFFTIGLSWLPLSWGGLPLLFSLYLSICGMGLIYSFVQSQKMTWLNSMLLGLLFLISLHTYPIAVLFLLFWFLLILITKILPKPRVINNRIIFTSLFFNRKNLGLIIAFCIPLLFSLPFIYSYYTNFIAGFHFYSSNYTLSSTSALSAEIMKTRINFNWVLDIPALFSFFSEYGKMLSIASFSLILLILLLSSYLSQRIKSFFSLRVCFEDFHPFIFLR